TTVCRLFLEQIPANCNVAYIFNPKLTVIELLQSVCDEFHVAVPAPGPQPPTVKDYLDPLNAFLLREHAGGRNNVLIIDEAQNLSAEVLEQLRLLTNLETSERKLLQIVLIGQPELRAMLARPELEQLAQRVIARFHLDALTETETAQYVQHRLEVAGLTQALPFERKALRRVHKRSRGVPRRINLLCDRAMLGAFAGGHARVSAAIVDKAAGEVFDGPAVRAAPPWRGTAAVLGLGLLAGVGLFAMMNPPWKQADTKVVARPAPAPKAAAASLPASAAAAPVLLTDENQAWRELAGAWKLAPGAGEPCQAVQREQVRCFSGTMSLALIRQLGRPGVLTLDAQGGAPAYALLTGLGPASATLRAAGGEQTVTLAALATRWRGEFGTLWRVPAGYGGRIGDRDSGLSVDWLATRLAQLDGVAAPRGKQVLDARLKSRVLAFQLAQGLPADGRPGPLTFMQLNRASGVDEPRLRTEP
ncbi:MAG: AAA family ATPase, partial [Ramlibacter sp.]